jgi:hypothetical protein
MPGCNTCLHRQRSNCDAQAGEIDCAPKAECKQHTGYGVPDLILLPCREYRPAADEPIPTTHDRPDALH